MNLHESSEDYLEKILMLQKKFGHVRSIDVANDMNFSRASVSRAMKNLKNDGYLEFDEKNGIVLTAKGLEIAESMLARHEFLSKFFIELGIPSETAVSDACRVEHDLSRETYLALVAFINSHRDE